MDKKNNKIKIGDTESIVLQILWQSEEAMSVNDVNEQLRQDGITWAYTTVATILKRMEKKQLVSYEKIDRTFYYRPIVEKINVVNGAKNYVDRYFRGSLSRFLTAFTKDEQLTREDIEDLKEWVNKLDDK